MPAFAVTVVGRDRPGIVAAVCEALLEARANIEDSRMTVLRGHLAMTLIVALPDRVEVDRLRAALEAVRDRLELDSASLTEVADAPVEGSAGAATHVVSVYGVDHPGIAHAVSSTLARRGWNITDLETRLVGEDGPDALYAMLIEVALEADAGEELERALAPVARAEGVEISARPIERDVL